MKILMVGDIVGGPGRAAFAEVAKRYRAEGKADVVVANAENAAGGRGLTAPLAEEIFAAGADLITLGDHTWDQKGFGVFLAGQTRMVRPANFAPGCPGRGVTTLSLPQGSVTVISLVGRVFLPPVECPFRTADAILAKRSELGKVILVDMHAEATAEKVVLGHYLDGRVTAVVGTHTHVQTSDERLLPKGTAYITDLGMTGPWGSAIGRDLETITRRFISGMPEKFIIAGGDTVVEGVIIDVASETGKAVSITRVREHLPAKGRV